jgi:hypothetical protein
MTSHSLIERVISFDEYKVTCGMVAEQGATTTELRPRKPAVV